jgi:hypothetical protein
LTLPIVRDGGILAAAVISIIAGSIDQCGPRHMGASADEHLTAGL